MTEFSPSAQMTADTERWEGKSYKVYADSRGYPTNGIGNHNGVHFGDPDIDEATVQSDLARNLQNAYTGAQSLFPALDKMDIVRREVLIGLVFNMGRDTLSLFGPFIRAANQFDWNTAAFHLETNLSHHLTPYLLETGARAVECALRLDDGEVLEEFRV